MKQAKKDIKYSNKSIRRSITIWYLLIRFSMTIIICRKDITLPARTPGEDCTEDASYEVNVILFYYFAW